MEKSSPFDLNLRHLRAFLVVCDQGSVSLAAQLMGLSQPALTQAIGKLERQLGVALFERLGQGMRATAAAQSLMPRVAAALRHLSVGARLITGQEVELDRRVTAHQLRAFLSLVETRSFLAVGLATDQSASSAQRSVRSIEITLGKPLLDRRGRNVIVNAVGRRFARSCRLAIHELQAAFADLGIATESPRIALGTTPLARALLVPEAMIKTRTTSMLAGFQVLEGSWGELVEVLRDGLIDIIVGELPDYQSPDIVKISLYSESMVIVAGRQHPLAQRAHVTLQDLAAYPWIIGPETSPLRAEWERMFPTNRPPSPIECGSVMVIGRLLTSDDLLTLATPDQVALQIRAGLLTQIGEPLQRLHTIGITMREGWQPTATQKNFLAQLRAVALEMYASPSKASFIGAEWV
jgi:LysR family transcriptional regulator of gallate degradation